MSFFSSLRLRLFLLLLSLRSLLAPLLILGLSSYPLVGVHASFLECVVHVEAANLMFPSAALRECVA
jgi:hypothetical protein